jgi:hypothetical protein
VLFVFRSGCWFSLRSVLHFLACSVLSQHHRSSVLRLELFPHQFLVCVKVVTLLRESVTRSFFSHCQSSSLSRSRIGRFEGSPSIGPQGCRAFLIFPFSLRIAFWISTPRRTSAAGFARAAFSIPRAISVSTECFSSAPTLLLRSSGLKPAASVVLLGVPHHRAPPWCYSSVGFQWSTSSVLGPSFGCFRIHKKG